MRSIRTPEKFFSKENWQDLEWVKHLALQFGPGMSVIKYPERDNYNITHTSREGALPNGVEILMRT